MNPFPAISDWHLAQIQGQVAALASLNQPITEFKPITPIDPNDELHAWMDQVYRQVQTDDHQFALHLPDDDTPLPARIESLGAFCQGFIDTLTDATSRSAHALASASRPETMPIVRDIMEISRISADVTGDDQDEHDFMELAEYLRVAVRLFALNLKKPES